MHTHVWYRLGVNSVIHAAPCKPSGHPTLQKRKQSPGERVMPPKSQQLGKWRGQDELQLELNAKLPSSGCLVQTALGQEEVS